MAVQDTEEAQKALMEAGGFTFPVMLDLAESFRPYDVAALPTTVLIDAEGRIVDTFVGGVTAEELWRTRSTPSPSESPAIGALTWSLRSPRTRNASHHPLV